MLEVRDEAARVEADLRAVDDVFAFAAAERAAGLAAAGLAPLDERVDAVLRVVPLAEDLRAVAVLRAAAALRVVDDAPNFDCDDAARLAAVPADARRAGVPFFSSAPTRSARCSTWPRTALRSSTTLRSSSCWRTRWTAPVISSTSSVTRSRVPAAVASKVPATASRTWSGRDFFLPFFFLSAMVARLYSRMAEPIHLRPHAPVAERVLLPGDPGRALRLAQALTDQPRMLNHHRGLWGYTGTAADGELLTIQSTGMGGPSAAIVVAELADLGATDLVRVGTCGALAPEAELGELIAVEEVRAEDGTSRALGAGSPLRPDAGLAARLRADRRGAVVTTDLFYDPAEDRERTWAADGALAVEMECAAVLAVAAQRGLRAGALLLVSDLVLPERRRIEADALREGEERLGRRAAAALGA